MFVSVSFRSQTDQGTSGRWTDSHGAIEFRTSTGGFSGWTIDVGKPGVMEPIGFCHVVQPLVPSLPHISWGNRFVGSKYLWCLEA